MDLFKLDESQRNALIALLEDFPEYCTLIFIYDTLDYKRDGKMKKLCAALDKHVCAVEFAQQERAQLVNWLRRRFTALGHDIDSSAADHLLFTCGTLMTDLVPEIEKIAAYAKQERITIDDINAVADPVLDARVFDMTNCVTAGKYDDAARVLADLLRMQTEPIAILAALGKELRKLYTARMALDTGKDRFWLKRLSRQAAAAGGEKGGSRLVQQRRHPLPAAGSPHEKRAGHGQRGGAEAVPDGIGRCPVKPRIREVIIVEGRYDKNALSQVVDAVILTTEGFGVFHDKEKLSYFRRLAEQRGVILLTDPDGAGFVIRNHLKGALPPERVKQAYVPDVPGKERRKKKGGKEGKLGVEGMSPAVLLEALRRCGATFEGEESRLPSAGITRADLMDKGLMGPNSAAKRAAVLQTLQLPEHLTTTGLLDALNLLLTREEFDTL